MVFKGLLYYLARVGFAEALFFSDLVNLRHTLMDTLTAELKQAVEQAGDAPVRLMDPETHRAYVLVRAEVFEQLLLDDEDRREREAFLRASKKNARARLLEDE